MAKITLTLPDGLLQDVDEDRQRHYQTRSAYVAASLKMRLQTNKAVELMPVMVETFKTAVELQIMGESSDVEVEKMESLLGEMLEIGNQDTDTAEKLDKNNSSGKGVEQNWK